MIWRGVTFPSPPVSGGIHWTYGYNTTPSQCCTEVTKHRLQHFLSFHQEVDEVVEVVEVDEVDEVDEVVEVVEVGWSGR